MNQNKVGLFSLSNLHDPVGLTQPEINPDSKDKDKVVIVSLHFLYH